MGKEDKNGVEMGEKDRTQEVSEKGGNKNGGDS